MFPRQRRQTHHTIQMCYSYSYNSTSTILVGASTSTTLAEREILSIYCIYEADIYNYKRLIKFKCDV
jgi:hypothetical protein